MRDIARALLPTCLMFTAIPALANPEAIVTPLVTKELPDFKGKEAVMILVEYPPGASDPIHRHDAYAFVYVLEGSIVMLVIDRSGSPPVTSVQLCPPFVLRIARP